MLRPSLTCSTTVADVTSSPTSSKTSKRRRRSKVEEIKVGKQTFHVLFPKLLRPLTPKEERDLDASILQYGVKYAVHTDKENGIIDGANRCRLASKHNLPIQVRAHRGLSLEEKRQLALSLNLDRRHITQKEREQAKAERVELAAQKHR